MTERHKNAVTKKPVLTIAETPIDYTGLQKRDPGAVSLEAYQSRLNLLVNMSILGGQLTAADADIINAIAPTVADVKHEYLDSLKKDNARVRAHVAAEDAKANALKV